MEELKTNTILNLKLAKLVFKSFDDEVRKEYNNILGNDAGEFVNTKKGTPKANSGLLVIKITNDRLKEILGKRSNVLFYRDLLKELSQKNTIISLFPVIMLNMIRKRINNEKFTEKIKTWIDSVFDSYGIKHDPDNIDYYSAKTYSLIYNCINPGTWIRTISQSKVLKEGNSNAALSEETSFRAIQPLLFWYTGFPDERSFFVALRDKNILAEFDSIQEKPVHASLKKIRDLLLMNQWRYYHFHRNTRKLVIHKFNFQEPAKGRNELQLNITSYREDEKYSGTVILHISNDNCIIDITYKYLDYSVTNLKLRISYSADEPDFNDQIHILTGSYTKSDLRTGDIYWGKGILEKVRKNLDIKPMFIEIAQVAGHCIPERILRELIKNCPAVNTSGQIPRESGNKKGIRELTLEALNRLEMDFFSHDFFLACPVEHFANLSRGDNGVWAKKFMEPIEELKSRALKAGYRVYFDTKINNEPDTGTVYAGWLRQEIEALVKSREVIFVYPFKIAERLTASLLEVGASLVMARHIHIFADNAILPKLIRSSSSELVRFTSHPKKTSTDDDFERFGEYIRFVIEELFPGKKEEDTDASNDLLQKR